MKTVCTLLISLGLFASFGAAQAAGVMLCTATHPQTEVQFTGEGMKWIGAKQALEACQNYALANDLNASLCAIKSCEPVFSDF